jgi:hypothetical protein
MERQQDVLIYGRRVPLRFMAVNENELRLLEIDQPDATRALAGDTLSRWARFLELSLFFASLHDAVSTLGLATVADVIRDSDRVEALVVTFSRLDVRRVLTENAAVLRPYETLRPHANEPVIAETDVVRRAVQSLLLHCPMEGLDRLREDHGLAEVGHRCRLAYDGLQAFVARHSHPNKAAVIAAGRVYAEGRATLDEVAAMLSLPVPDVVALLEEGGFRRSIDGLRLTEEQRRDRVARIREDRVRRAGEPDPSDAHIARDVIASQRIEGIDARPWLQR